MSNETLQCIIAGAAVLCALTALFGPIIWKNLEEIKETEPHVQKPLFANEPVSFKKNDDLTKREIVTLYNGRCPDCDAESLLEGPSAGMSVNVYCGNEKCGSRFNVMGPFGAQRITDASPNKYITVEHDSPYRN